MYKALHKAYMPKHSSQFLPLQKHISQFLLKDSTQKFYSPTFIWDSCFFLSYWSVSIFFIGPDFLPNLKIDTCHNTTPPLLILVHDFSCVLNSPITTCISLAIIYNYLPHMISPNHLKSNLYIKCRFSILHLLVVW